MESHREYSQWEGLAMHSMGTWGKSVENDLGVLLAGPLAMVFTVVGGVAILFYPGIDAIRGVEKAA